MIWLRIVCLIRSVNDVLVKLSLSDPIALAELSFSDPKPIRRMHRPKCKDDDSVQLAITIISAQNLKKSRLWGKMRAYALAWISPETRLATHVDFEGDENPSWNTTMTFLVSRHLFKEESSGIITIEIYNCGHIVDTLLGTVGVLLSNIYARGKSHGGTQFCALQIRRPSGRGHGILNIGSMILESEDYTSLESPIVPIDVGDHEWKNKIPIEKTEVLQPGMIVDDHWEKNVMSSNKAIMNEEIEEVQSEIIINDHGLNKNENKATLNEEGKIDEEEMIVHEQTPTWETNQVPLQMIVDVQALEKNEAMPKKVTLDENSKEAQVKTIVDDTLQKNEEESKEVLVEVVVDHLAMEVLIEMTIDNEVVEKIEVPPKKETTDPQTIKEMVIKDEKNEVTPKEITLEQQSKEVQVDMIVDDHALEKNKVAPKKSNCDVESKEVLVEMVVHHQVVEKIELANNMKLEMIVDDQALHKKVDLDEESKEVEIVVDHQALEKNEIVEKNKVNYQTMDEDLNEVEMVVGNQGLKKNEAQSLMKVNMDDVTKETHSKTIATNEVLEKNEVSHRKVNMNKEVKEEESQMMSPKKATMDDNMKEAQKKVSKEASKEAYHETKEVQQEMNEETPMKSDEETKEVQQEMNEESPTESDEEAKEVQSRMLIARSAISDDTNKVQLDVVIDEQISINEAIMDEETNQVQSNMTSDDEDLEHCGSKLSEATLGQGRNYVTPKMIDEDFQKTESSFAEPCLNEETNEVLLYLQVDDQILDIDVRTMDEPLLDKATMEMQLKEKNVFSSKQLQALTHDMLATIIEEEANRELQIEVSPVSDSILFMKEEVSEINSQDMIQLVRQDTSNINMNIHIAQAHKGPMIVPQNVIINTNERSHYDTFHGKANNNLPNEVHASPDQVLVFFEDANSDKLPNPLLMILNTYDVQSHVESTSFRDEQKCLMPNIIKEHKQSIPESTRATLASSVLLEGGNKKIIQDKEMAIEMRRKKRYYERLDPIDGVNEALCEDVFEDAQSSLDC